jgi:hypothetical protein
VLAMPTKMWFLHNVCSTAMLALCLQDCGGAYTAYRTVMPALPVEDCGACNTCKGVVLAMRLHCLQVLWCLHCLQGRGACNAALQHCVALALPTGLR